MKGLKKKRLCLTTLILMVIMATASGCVIVVSDKMAEEGANVIENVIEEVNVGDFFDGYRTPKLLYAFYGENEFSVMRRQTDGGKVVIPDMVGDRMVTHVQEAAFFATDIHSVEIGANVKFIDKNAFAGCNNLKQAKFSVTDNWYINEEEVKVEDVKNEEKAAELLRQGGVWERKE